MTLYYITPARLLINLDTETFWRNVRKCPKNAINIDLISAEPGNTETRTEEMRVHMFPKSVLHVSAWDLITLITALFAIGWISKTGISSRCYRLFYGNPDDAVKSAIRAAFNLKAPGECDYYKNRQINSRPNDWAQLHRAWKPLKNVSKSA